MTEKREGAQGRIIDAFNKLMLARKSGRPRVAEIVAEAGVARSTVYEKFDGKDGVLLEAFKGPLSIIAKCATSDADTEYLIGILKHFRERRADVGSLLTGPLMNRITRLLAALIDERSHATPLTRDAALHIADSQIAFIRLWLIGETRYTPEALASLMRDHGRAQRAFFQAQSQ